MLKVLVNAYACSPGMGSEPGMGWNWCVNLAKYCQLHIITEGEFKDKIESSLQNIPQKDNMHFYYNLVSDEVRQMCWNQGDWRFYKHYRKWQLSTYKMALQIIANEKIDIVHQLNMIGFREPGYLWKIQDVRYVWGPIGGLKQFPVNYLQGASLKMKVFNRLKNCVNIFQIKYHRRVNAAIKRADLLVSAIPDSFRAIKKYKNKDSIIIPETGCNLTEYDNTNRFDDPELQIMWVGKFDFRKQLPLALAVIAKAKNKNLKLNVYGSGSPEQIVTIKEKAKSLRIVNQVIWHGTQSNEITLQAMRKSHLLFFTSISDDTSTVVLEAISNGLPILCFDTCGFGAVVDNKIGRKIKLSSPKNSIVQFADTINHLDTSRELLKELSLNCKTKQEELSWDNKALQMIKLYKHSIKQFKEGMNKNL
jgi:glycosyltransferase involved in cell wall biosynthesis